MFAFGAMIALAQAMAEQREELAFRKSLEGLPIEEQIRMSTARDQRKEKARLEQIQERRHRETCEAIKEAGRAANPNRYF